MADAQDMAEGHGAGQGRADPCPAAGQDDEEPDNEELARAMVAAIRAGVPADAMLKHWARLALTIVRLQDAALAERAGETPPGRPPPDAAERAEDVTARVVAEAVRDGLPSGDWMERAARLAVSLLRGQNGGVPPVGAAGQDRAVAEPIISTAPGY